MTNLKFYRTGKNIIERFPVPVHLKDWNIEWNDYKPIPVIIDFGKKPWADPNLEDFHPKWNQLDGKIDRQSHCGQYSIDKDGFPLNPTGRTGINMRGLLGRWGPNHAADPIVTRWKRDEKTNKIIKHNLTDKPIMQFVAIQRKDVSEWAIPGGMIDPGEKLPETLKREFFEESLNYLESSPSERNKINEKLKTFFTIGGKTIFKGYVNDPRNTDNAWIETVAVNFHDENGDIFNSLLLKAGDDAKNVCWMDIDRNAKLYANHLDFIEATVKNKSGHW